LSPEGRTGGRASLANWATHGARLAAWRQTPDEAVPGPDDAADLIERVGLATVYPASTEIADLFHAHVGDPDAKTDSKHDSPSGEVYAWRWHLGRRHAAFYGTVVRKRPTFVAWPLLPAVLRLVADLRTPDELYDFGVISGDAYRIAQVLDEAPEPLGTGDIRRQAGFPTGRDQSNAYHKGLAELENRLLVTSEFPAGDAEGNKHHGLIFTRRGDDVLAAEGMTREEAMLILLRAYLPSARYVVPRVVARDLRLSETELLAVMAELESEGEVMPVEAPGMKDGVWMAGVELPQQARLNAVSDALVME
jgi:hypothetical protein